MGRALTACFVLVMLLSAIARVANADPLDDDTRRIGKQLQCPVCSGASVADSPSDLAGQMRNVIRTRLQAGENDQQIIAYFVERYGDGVLIEPPRRGVGLIVWTAPLAMLGIGGILLWRLLRSWLRPRWSPASTPIGQPESTYQNGTAHADGPALVTAADRARAELDQFRREA